MSDDTAQAGVADAELARAELYDTLAQLRDRLDFAQRIDDRVARCRDRIADEKDTNPVGFAVGVAMTAAVAGLAAWGVARAIIDRIR